MGTPRRAIPTSAATYLVWGLFLSLNPAAARKAPARTTAGEWPKSFSMSNGATLTINQPQIAEWPNEAAVTFYAAAVYRADPTAKPSLGTIVVEANTAVSFRDRLVRLSRFSVVHANFPTVTEGEASEIVAMLERHLPPDARTMTLDAVLAAVDSRPAAAARVAGIKADPPFIFVSKRPAILVVTDGGPIWRHAGSGALQYAINTNWDLFHDAASNTYYLRNDHDWLSATNVLGPWTCARRLPSTFEHLPAQPRWDAVRASVPARRSAAAAPRVFVSRQPSELIVIEGEASYRRVAGTGSLNWVSNTDADLFRQGSNGTVYYLVGGRWFAAPDFMGPWTFATHTLPADFRKIPLDHPRSHVLASVPGTPQATAAVLLAEVPQTARVNKKGLKAPSVGYDGDPVFQLIAGTPILRAINTDKDVLKAGRQFYLCADGVWFAATAPTGAWRVTGDIPLSVYDIPPASPLYRVTHVTVKEDYDDWIVFSATAAYRNMIVANGLVVWGTGYAYEPYVGGTENSPVYFRRPSTYGAGAWYNPWTASFGRARNGYGPSAAAPLSAALYESWDPRLVQAEDHIRAMTDAASAIVGTSGRITPTARVSSIGAMLAGRDGCVYRHRGGSWEKYQRGGWVPLHHLRPGHDAVTRQVIDDARARAEGVERRRTASRLQDEWGVRAASYRPSAINSRGRQ